MADSNKPTIVFFNKVGSLFVGKSNYNDLINFYGDAIN
jgi:hypothetical protein